MTGTLLPGWALGLSNTAVTTGAGLLVQSTIIIAVGLALAFVLRRRGATAQSAILRAFLAAVFLCPPATILLQRAGVRGITFEIPLAPSVQAVRSIGISPEPSSFKSTIAATENMATAPSRSESSARTAPSSSPVILKNRIPQHQALNGNQAARPLSAPPAARRDSHNPVSYAFTALLALFFTLLWAVCALFLLGRLLLHHCYILSIRHSAVAAKPSALAACRAAAHTLGVRPIPVLQSPSVHSPFLAGILRPRVFLPLGGVETVLEERSVFLHELAHLARHDTSWNLARQVAVALFPFQPLLWVLSARIEEMSDYACDDYVTHATGMHNTYANSLIAIARRSHPALREAVAGVGIISFKSPMRRRVERILDLSRTITLRVGTRLLVLVSSLCLCMTFLSGLIGFRESFAQARKFSEALTRGGRTAIFTLLPLVEKQVTIVLKPSDEPSGTMEAVQREDIAPADETLTSESENTSESAAAPTVSTDIPTRNVSALSGGESDQVRPAASEPDPVPGLAASDVGNPTVEKTVGKRTASTLSAPFLPPALNETLALSPNTGSIEGDVKTGELNINAKEQETYSGLKSNLDWGKRSPVWSPDGKTIAFTEYTGFGIWIAPATGGEPRLVYDNRGEWEYQGRKFGGGNMRTLCFTPDGASITIVNYIFDRTKGSRADFRGVDVTVYGIVPVIENVEIATGYKRIITMDAIDGCWSTDGKIFIAVTDPEEGKTLGQIVSIDLVADESRILAEAGASPCITPDGSILIYTDGRSLYRVPLAGGDPERLPVDGCLWNPRCSPDGDWVLGTGNTGGEASRTWLKAFNLLTGETRDIPYSEAENVEMGSWSPSGKQFCYTKSARQGNVGAASIWIADFRLESGGSPASAEEHVPARFKLIGNYPNPFNPSTTIEFSLPSDGNASLAVYNMAGQKVRELVTGQLSAGKHAVVWNGRDSSGNPVSSGVFIARLKMEGKVESHRMTLVK